jgi:hypothetical protein
MINTKTNKMKAGRNKRDWYIMERHNPQFDKPYYVGVGEMTIGDARRAEGSIYGCNYMNRFETEEDYRAELDSLKAAGFSVRLRRKIA